MDVKTNNGIKIRRNRQKFLRFAYFSFIYYIKFAIRQKETDFSKLLFYNKQKT